MTIVKLEKPLKALKGEDLHYRLQNMLVTSNVKKDETKRDLDSGYKS